LFIIVVVFVNTLIIKVINIILRIVDFYNFVFGVDVIVLDLVDVTSVPGVVGVVVDDDVVAVVVSVGVGDIVVGVVVAFVVDGVGGVGSVGSVGGVVGIDFVDVDSAVVIIGIFDAVVFFTILLFHDVVNVVVDIVLLCQ
jgi:hypothetical protein